MVNRGDEIKVKVVEVDPERGRIGLRLADDPDVEGKSPEELAKVGTGDRGPRGGAGGARAATAGAATAAGETASRVRTSPGSPSSTQAFTS